MRPALVILLVTTALPAQELTFSQHIAPIVFQNCTSCHRPGEIGPFSLTNYKEVSRKARMIRRVVERGLMPPWNPVAGHGEFEGERRLTRSQIAQIGKWIEQGKKAGDPSLLPSMPTFHDGWRHGKPDLIVKMPKPYPVPADGPDIYRNFVVPVGLAEDRWVRGFELRPGARTVLHHALVNLDTSGRARRQDGTGGVVGFRGMGSSGGSLGIWAVGAAPRMLPEGLAMKLHKGADIVLASHFHLSGKPEQEQTTLGIYFAKEPPKRTIVPLQFPPMWGFAYRIDIPAGKKDYKVRDWEILPADCEAVEVSSHAHMICRDMKATATLPDGKIVKLFYIADWNFNWQGGYTYKAPVALPKGTRIDVEFTYDNSTANKNNPHDPPKRVRVGRETTDEMARVTLTLVPKDEKDAGILRRRLSRMARISTLGARRLIEHDANGDGVLEASELPERHRGLLDSADKNGDGKLDRGELTVTRVRRRRR